VHDDARLMPAPTVGAVALVGAYAKLEPGEYPEAAAAEDVCTTLWSTVFEVAESDGSSTLPVVLMQWLFWITSVGHVPPCPARTQYPAKSCPPVIVLFQM
jgi:hypothetical protein